MTTPSDADALLAAYLADGMDVLPDRVVDAVLDEVSRPRQRAVLGPWRTDPCSGRSSARRRWSPCSSWAASPGPGGFGSASAPRRQRRQRHHLPCRAPQPARRHQRRRRPSHRNSAVRPSTPDGMLAVGRDDAILLIDPDTGTTVRRLSVPDPLVTDIAWAPDGDGLAFTSAGEVRGNALADETPRKIMSCRDGPDGCSIAWSPDGVAIAVAHGHRVELIDPDNGETAVMHVFVDLGLRPDLVARWSAGGCHRR